MSGENRPYRPTKLCPHRLCLPLHSLAAVPTLMLAVHDLLDDWRFVLLGVAGVPVVWLIYWAVHNKSPIDVAMEDLADTGTGGLRRVARPGWARVAVGCDVVIFALLASSVGRMAAGERTRGFAEAVEPAEFFARLAIVGPLIWFLVYAHRKATDPVKPVRAAVPAPVEGI